MNDDDLRRAFDDLLEPLPPLGALPPATARRATRRRRVKLAAAGAGGAGALALVATLALSVTGSTQSLVPPPVAGTPTPSVEPSPEPPPPVRPTAPPVQPSATATTTGEPEAAAPQEVSVVLRPDGLGFTDGGPSSSSLAFGTDEETVRAAVDRALGAGGELETPDCGPDASTVQYEGLFLLLQGGDFIGWRTGSPGLTTGDGIGVGSTLADLRASFAEVTVTESTIGVEWSTGDGGLSGTLEGTDETSRVNSMGGGSQCIFR